MYSIQKTFTNFAWVYFLLLVILGNFFLLNLNLAVIKVKFSEAHSLMSKNKSFENNPEIKYDLVRMKKEKIWKSYINLLTENDNATKTQITYISKNNLNNFLFKNQQSNKINKEDDNFITKDNDNLIENQKIIRKLSKNFKRFNSEIQNENMGF